MELRALAVSAYQLLSGGSDFYVITNVGISLVGIS